MVMLQIERDGHAVKLGARIATPSEPVARGIDSELPTIVFCHPTWMDSYFL
jgi:hypothetical protein